MEKKDLNKGDTCSSSEDEEAQPQRKKMKENLTEQGQDNDSNDVDNEDNVDDDDYDEGDDEDDDDNSWEHSPRSESQLIADIALLDEAIDHLTNFDPVVSSAEEETFEGFEEAEEDNDDDDSSDDE